MNEARYTHAEWLDRIGRDECTIVPDAALASLRTSLAEHIDAFEFEYARRREAESRAMEADSAIRDAIPERFILVPPDGGDVKTLEAVQAMVEALASAEAERERLALALLVADVADYPAWQRPCHALDVARAILEATKEPMPLFVEGCDYLHGFPIAATKEPTE